MQKLYTASSSSLGIPGGIHWSFSAFLRFSKDVQKLGRTCAAFALSLCTSSCVHNNLHHSELSGIKTEVFKLAHVILWFGNTRLK